MATNGRRATSEDNVIGEELRVRNRDREYNGVNVKCTVDVVGSWERLIPIAGLYLFFQVGVWGKGVVAANFNETRPLCHLAIQASKTKGACFPT